LVGAGVLVGAPGAGVCVGGSGTGVFVGLRVGVGVAEGSTQTDIPGAGYMQTFGGAQTDDPHITGVGVTHLSVDPP